MDRGAHQRQPLPACRHPYGIWASSENGISLDNSQPEMSTIPGVGEYLGHYGRTIVLKANTFEGAIDQYGLIVNEKTMADRCMTDSR